MKQYIGSFIFCIGLSFLIIVLTSTIYFLKKENNLSDGYQSSKDISLKIEYDEFKASTLELFEISDTIYDFVEFGEIQNLCLKLQYQNDIDENYMLLSQKLLGYLQNADYPIDIIDNNFVHMNSFPLNKNLTITFLDFLENPSSKVYITQKTKENTSVYFVCSLTDVVYVSHTILDTGEIVVHFNSQEKGYNILAVFGEKNHQPALLSFYTTDEFISIRNSNDISIGGIVYQPKIEKDIIYLIGKEESLKGKAYDKDNI